MVLRKCILCVAGVAVIAFALGAAACNKSSDERKPGPATRRAVPRAAPRTEPARRGIELVELDIGLEPDAVTRATPGLPKGFKPLHLRAEGKQRAAFMVTPGMKNLAIYKTVTAGEKPPVGDVDQITDGIKKSGKFDYVEFSQAGWVQIDLAGPRTIHAVVIWHFYKNATIYSDVIVRLADDAACTRNVRTLFNNDHDNSSGMGQGADKAFYTRWWGEIVDARGENHAGTPARYVRVYTGEGWEGEPPRFVEISVYGK